MCCDAVGIDLLDDTVTTRLLLKFPFLDPRNADDEKYNILNCNLDFDTIPVSESLRDLLRHMLDRDQKTRYTADEVINHPWMQRDYEEIVFDDYHYPTSESYLERDPSSTSEEL